MHYPYHPQYNNFVNVIGKKSYRGQEHFIVKQPDSSYALLPAWMCSEKVKDIKLTNKSQVSIIALQNLNKLIKCDQLFSNAKKLMATNLPGEQDGIRKSKRNRENIKPKYNRKKSNNSPTRRNNRVVRKSIA